MFYEFPYDNRILTLNWDAENKNWVRDRKDSS